MINQLENIDKSTVIFESDENRRRINIYELFNTQLCGLDLYYPNIILFSGEKYYFPIEEKIMSLKSVKNEKNIKFETKKYKFIENQPVFYFVYNTDNYYHFIYDTLPYLISYFKLKNKVPNLKLLMNFPNKKQNHFYKFVSEFLEILGISSNDVICVDENTQYKHMYISSSYTHGIDSNLPPRIEIYEFYRNIVNNILKKEKITDLPKKVYISRRTWINNDFSNIGTNYTTRRKLENEDELVESLEKLGFKEVFTESLSTVEKILMFANAELIIGAIGGGLVNVLFSNSNCKLISLNSPTFLEINKRFIYSFKNVNTIHFNETEHTDNNEFKKYMRVQVDKIVGEIVDIYEDDLLVSYNDTPVAGWNNDINYKTIRVKKMNCTKLDNGLNSPWKIDINKLLNILI